MKKNYFGWPLIIAAILLSTVNLQAQVTVGSEIPPTRAALLELKTQQQTGTASGPAHDDNITSDVNGGGLLLPRVKLHGSGSLMPFIPDNDPDLAELKIKLTGLIVYNIATIGISLYPGLYIWNGSAWTTSQANPSAFAIAAQPKTFTFYEQGTETAEALTFGVTGGETPYTYQWHQLVSNNVHVRVGVPVSEGMDFDQSLYYPTQIIKGTTRNANNTGFYRFYCVAKDANGVELTSDVAEVAVGCGGKTKDGKWMSFMCFNLGADNGITIEEQKGYSITLPPTNDAYAYILNEEKVYGDLFQWGRIPDGHEKRTSANIDRGVLSSAEIVNGSRCYGGDTYRPYYQVEPGSNWDSKFITTATGNWNPILVQTYLDNLWRSGRSMSNDPCSHYKENGDYQEFWHPGPDLSSAGVDACTDAGTAWRIPSQAEWAELYRGGIIAGLPSDAEANTWYWNSDAGKPHGYELRPDDVTTTLFLPTSGVRNYETGGLYLRGFGARYWSSTVSSSNQAIFLNFTNNEVNPAYSIYRSSGLALRCIKN